MENFLQYYSRRLCEIPARSDDVKVAERGSRSLKRAKMKLVWIIFVVLISDTQSIQTRSQRPVRFVDEKLIRTRNFRHIDVPVNDHLEWEHGLREATVQALLREHIGDLNLRKHIYSAPLLGKQNKATPFGDIAILARGQLYANYAGFIFVQDPYQNDCDDCHNIEAEPIRGRCINSHCQIWHPRNKEHLIALWSIKRIRHRSPSGGYNKQEIEFTISPIGLRHPKEGFLTKDGTFNYNFPGHVFVLRSPESHQNLNLVQNLNHFKHGAFIAQTPDGRKYILHSFPGILTPETPRYQTPKDSLPTTTITTTQYSEDAKKVYQTLLELLHKKTSLDPNRLTPPTEKTSTTISDTTLVQFPDGQVVPITEIETPFITKTTPGYITVRFPETSSPERPQEQMTTFSRPLIKSSTTDVVPQTFVPTYSHMRPHMPQQTTFHAPPTTNGYTPQTINTMPIYTKATSRPQYHGTTPERTTPPVKMTFHFFAAEEDKPTIAPTSKRPLSTLSEEEYTKKQNVLPDTLIPTSPTTVFSTKSVDTTLSNARPATVVEITKPVAGTTYFSNEVSSTYHTKEADTTVPSIPYEPSTATYTTKRPFTDFTIPITVLNDFENKYITTGIAQSQTPLTSVREPTVTVSSTKYTNTHLYNPTTTKITPELNADTTIIQGPAKGGDTTFIETTLGVTTVMGSSQNKSTEMVYYATQETEQTPTRTSFVGSTEPTSSLLETKPMSTPKRIVTTIAADGTVSVKTTPFYLEEELFGLTKGSTKKFKTTKTYKVSSTVPSDFLVDDSSQKDYKIPRYKKPLNDYSEDDIFGTIKGNNANVSPKSTATKKYTKSDIEQALFDNNSRKSKALVRRKSSTTESTPPKVLYSHSYEASTLAMTTQSPLITLPTDEIVTPRSTKISKRPKLTNNDKVGKQDDKMIPVTSQSYLTSISYEVNKRKKPTSKYLIENNRNGTLANKETDERHKMMKRIDDDDVLTKEFHNDFALRLVSQAKGVAYLDDVSTTSVSIIGNISIRATKKPKYTRRRSHVSRAKRPKRRKGDDIVKSR